MKKFAPYLVIVAFIAVLVGGWWYERSISSVAEDVMVSTSQASSLTAKQMRDAADTATQISTGLKVNGKVPLDASGLPRNPDPLFSPVK